MAKVSMQLESNTSTGVAKVKSFTDINPNATSEQLIAFAQGINALTTNQYVATNRIEKINCDTEIVPADTRPESVVTVTGNLSAAAVISGNANCTFTFTGDGSFSLANVFRGLTLNWGVNNEGNKMIMFRADNSGLFGNEPAPQAGDLACSIVISETDNYKGTTHDIFFV